MGYGYRGGKASSDLVHRWANRQTTKGKSSNIFVDGDTIYSYGYHFPMARHLDDNTVAFTNQSYSVTTSSHLGAVRGAISHKTIIQCWHIPPHDADWTHHSQNINKWIALVKDSFVLWGKARKKEKHIDAVENVRRQAKKYIDYFKVKLTKDQKQELFELTPEGYGEQVKIAFDKAERKRKADYNKGLKLHPAWLEAWRSFNEVDFGKGLSSGIKDVISLVEFTENGVTNDNKVRLRTDGATVFTSKNLNLPIDVARRYYNKYMAVLKLGGCNDSTKPCNYNMLEYPVKTMSEARLVVGCHDIARSEIDYIADKLGWIK